MCLALFKAWEIGLKPKRTLDLIGIFWNFEGERKQDFLFISIWNRVGKRIIIGKGSAKHLVQMNEIRSSELGNIFSRVGFSHWCQGKEGDRFFQNFSERCWFLFLLTKIENCTCIDFRIETRPTSMLSFFGNEVKRRGEGKRILDISLSF